MDEDAPEVFDDVSGLWRESWRWCFRSNGKMSCRLTLKDNPPVRRQHCLSGRLQSRLGINPVGLDETFCRLVLGNRTMVEMIEEMMQHLFLEL